MLFYITTFIFIGASIAKLEYKGEYLNKVHQEKNIRISLISILLISIVWTINIEIKYSQAIFGLLTIIELLAGYFILKYIRNINEDRASTIFYILLLSLVLVINSEYMINPGSDFLLLVSGPIFIYFIINKFYDKYEQKKYNSLKFNIYEKNIEILTNSLNKFYIFKYYDIYDEIIQIDNISTEKIIQLLESKNNNDAYLEMTLYFKDLQKTKLQESKKLLLYKSIIHETSVETVISILQQKKEKESQSLLALLKIYKDIAHKVNQDNINESDILHYIKSIEETIDVFKDYKIRIEMKILLRKLREELNNILGIGFVKGKNKLYFENCSGGGIIRCFSCHHKEEITAFTHGDHSEFNIYPGYQCQECGKFKTLHNPQDETNKCECEGILSRDNPIFCPKCKSLDMGYKMLYIT